MKLFDRTPIKDEYDWGIEIPLVADKEETSTIYYLADGFALGRYLDKDFLLVSKKMEDLDIGDINTIIQSHGIDFWESIKYISVYETNLAFAKFDKWLN
jgi:hypothetical protein